jgi:predicted PurR-regulated permease PerM
MKREVFIRPFFMLFLIVLFALCALILYPFLTAIVGAAVLAYIFRPVHKWLLRLVRVPSVSAILVTLLIMVVLVVPMLYAVANTADEARIVYLRGMQLLERGTLLENTCEPDSSVVCDAINTVDSWLTDPMIKTYIREGMRRMTNAMSERAADVLVSLPQFMISIVIFFFSTFYLLRDGDNIKRYLQQLIPVSRKHQKHIVQRLSDVTHALVFGSLIIAMVQGIVGGIGFWLAGIGSPVFWGLVISVLALVPMLGTGLVWVPASIYLLLAGIGTGESLLVWKGIGLFIYGAVVISGIDNILRPLVIGDRARIHPVLVLVGAIGGIYAFGFVGFVLGPLVIAALQSFISIYQEEFRHL